MIKVEQQNKLKYVLVASILIFVLVSQVSCNSKHANKEAKQRRGITEWRFKRMNEGVAAAAASSPNNMQIFGDYEFYLSLLPKEIDLSNEHEFKPIVFKLELVIFNFSFCFFLFSQLNFFKNLTKVSDETETEAEIPLDHLSAE
jgi:hypothetical protein